MKRKIQAVFSCLFILIFLAGNTGINLFIHTCYSSQKTQFIAYPEIFKHSTSCCCADEASSNPVPSSSKDTEIKNPECCRTQHLLLKAPFIGVPVTHYQLIKTIFFPIQLVESMILPVHQDQEPLSEYLPWLDHSPPFTGKTLIYFIHQIRIPSPVC